MDEQQTTSLNWQTYFFYLAIALLLYPITFYLCVVLLMYLQVGSEPSLITDIVLVVYRPMFWLNYVSETFYDIFMFCTSLVEEHTSTHAMYREWYELKFLD